MVGTGKRRKPAKAGGRKYTVAEKLAYYKHKANITGSGAYRITGGAQKIGQHPRMHGKGGYWSDLAKSATRGMAAKAGSMLGNQIAPGIGGAVGSAAGSLFSSLTGWGDYVVKENSITAPDTIVPSFGEDSVRIRKREYIGDIDATILFANNTFPINPGLSSVFPWLSDIAACFQQYRFNGLVFQLVTTSSTAIASSTNLGLGQMCMATNYDASDGPFQDLPTMLASTFANSGVPSENLMHAIECAPTDQAQILYYIRNGGLSSNEDIKTYDLGLLQIATQKMQSAYQGMAQLWVSYDITLVKAVNRSIDGSAILMDHWLINTPDFKNILGNGTSVLRAHSSLGTEIVANGGDYCQLNFPVSLQAGYFLIFGWWAGSTAETNTQMTFTPTQFESNDTCDLMTSWGNVGQNYVDNHGRSSSLFFSTWLVKINFPNAGFVLSTATIPEGTLVITDFVILQANGEIYEEDVEAMHTAKPMRKKYQTGPIVLEPSVKSESSLRSEPVHEMYTPDELKLLEKAKALAQAKLKA